MVSELLHRHTACAFSAACIVLARRWTMPAPCMQGHAHFTPCPSSPSPRAVRPGSTPLGGPQLPQFLAGGGGKGKDAAAQRRVLQDVTHHYAGSSKGICIGAMGGAFGMVDTSGLPATTCHQDAQAAAAAAKARVAAVRRQALRAMR